MRPPVIIGGGPAGSTAALVLRQAGQPVTLIERSTGPTDKPCGDFLGASAIRIAESLGLPLASLGARPVTHLRLIRHGNVTESPLPFRALALSRRRFDEALLDACREAGVDVLRGETARPPRADSQDFTIETGARGTITTGTVFLATGRPDGVALPLPPQPAAFTAYKMYLRPRADQRDALVGRVELIMLPFGQAALQRVEDDQVALCLLLRRRNPEDDWDRVLGDVLAHSPHLARRLAGATPLLARPVIARNIPFGYLHRGRAMDHDGLYRIGDRAAVPSSLVADGVSVAMRGATRAARSWLAGAGAGDYHRRLREMLWPRVRMVADYDPAPIRPPRPMPAMAGAAGGVSPIRDDTAPTVAPAGPTGTGVDGSRLVPTGPIPTGPIPTGPISTARVPSRLAGAVPDGFDPDTPPRPGTPSRPDPPQATADPREAARGSRLSARWGRLIA